MSSRAIRTKLRRMILVGAIATLVIPSNTSALDSTKIDTPVMATLSPGNIAAVWSQPVGQAIADAFSLEVCHDTDCYVANSYVRTPYTPNSKARRTSIIALFTLLPDTSNPSPFYLRNRGLPLTARISAGNSPSDSTRSDPSAPFYADPPDASPNDATQQFVQPVLTSLSTSSLSMGLCFNHTSDAFHSPDTSQWPVGLRFPGYSLTYEISKDGNVFQSGNSNILGGGIQGNWFNGRYCEDGPEGDERWQIYDPILMRGSRSPGSLDLGTTYTFTYRLISGSSPPISGSLDFTTPGGCPSTPPGPPKHLVKSNWSALLDNSGRYLTIFQGFSLRQSAYMSAVQSANIYLSPFKTYPFDSSFVYVPEIDDFAMDASSLINGGKFQIKDATIFKDCSPEQVQIAVSTEGVPGTSDELACQIVEGNIIPTRVGRCILRVQLTRKTSVTASGIRKLGFTFARNLAVDFSSIPTSQPANVATPSTTGASLSPVASVSKAPAVRLIRMTTGKSIASYLKLNVPSKSTIRLRIATTSLKFCKVIGTSVKGLKVGQCKLTISIKPQRGLTTSRTISLKVTK